MLDFNFLNPQKSLTDYIPFQDDNEWFFIEGVLEATGENNEIWRKIVASRNQFTFAPLLDKVETFWKGMMMNNNNYSAATGTGFFSSGKR